MDREDLEFSEVPVPVCSCGLTGEAATKSHLHPAKDFGYGPGMVPPGTVWRPGLSVEAAVREEEDRMFSEIRVTSETGGQKGMKDVQLHSTPWEALQALGRVNAFGRAKYQDYNYRRGFDWSLSFDAAVRHMFAFWSGETLDPESGLPHMAHAMWHMGVLVLFAAYPDIYGRFDDRPGART